MIIFRSVHCLLLLKNEISVICRSYVGCDLCFDWFHPEFLGMSDEDISAMLSSKTFLCPSCSKFGDIETLENAEEETTAVSNGF